MIQANGESENLNGTGNDWLMRMKFKWMDEEIVLIYNQDITPEMLLRFHLSVSSFSVLREAVRAYKSLDEIFHPGLVTTSYYMYALLQ